MIQKNFRFHLFLVCAIVLLVFVNSDVSYGQPTVGLLEYTESVSDAYTLFTPLASASTFLIDNCGNKINEWDGLQMDNSNLAKLGEDGILYRSSFNSLYKISWDNEPLWSFNLSDLDLLRHHDFEILPNGNFLFIASALYPIQDMIEKGRTPAGVGGGGNGTFKVDGIYELRPIGTNDAELVWSWNFFDHLVQDFDETKENFDDVANQPRRLDVNFNGEAGTAFDWLHCNGIDYHRELDQIIVSSRSTCELYIIDHSTTTEEAASSTGGNFGLGGDFLWRWGNPIAYDMGTEEDQQFWEQHDPKWIQNGFPNEGKITLFNNLFNFNFEPGDQPFSNVHILDPNATNGIYPMNPNGTFQPIETEFTYTGVVNGNNMWSNIMSNVQAMSNGNLFVSQGTTGEMFEINQEKELVWVYQNPVRNFIYDQGSDPDQLANSVDIFIVTKYPVDYQGFNGLDVSPSDILENENEVSVFCNNIVTTNSPQIESIDIFPNPTSDFLTIKTALPNYTVTLFNVFGNRLLQNSFSMDATLDLNNWTPGIYFLNIAADEALIENIKIIIK